MRIATIAAIAAVTLAAGAAKADTLDNLERERALLIEAFLDPGLAPADRHARVEAEQRRLVDLERMVLRDESLKGRNTPTVRKAFSNYDLTFIVHASLEKKVALVDTWLDQVGVSTNSLMAARKGRR